MSKVFEQAAKTMSRKERKGRKENRLNGNSRGVTEDGVYTPKFRLNQKTFAAFAAFA